MKPSIATLVIGAQVAVLISASIYANQGIDPTWLRISFLLAFFGPPITAGQALLAAGRGQIRIPTSILLTLGSAFAWMYMIQSSSRF